MDWLRSQPVVMQAFLAGLFTWGCTIVGSAVVFFFIHISRIMMGFAAGVMIAASFCRFWHRRLNMRKALMVSSLGYQLQ